MTRLVFLAKLCGTTDDDCSLGLRVLPPAGNCPNDSGGWLAFAQILRLRIFYHPIGIF